MPIIYTGNDFNGDTAYANGQFWINQEHETLSNTGTAFNFSSYDNVTIVVEGQVSGYGVNGKGIASDTSGSGIYNSVVVQENAKVYGEQFGIDLFGNSNTVNNHGHVDGQIGVVFRQDGATLYNDGKITGDTGGLYNNGEAASFYNSGFIKGGSYGVYSFGGTILENSGTIVGQNHGVYLSSGSDVGHLVNSGTIIGKNGLAIFGNSGDQNIYNTGKVFGNIDLGSGNDAYDGRGTGQVKGIIDGDIGNDTLRGGKFVDKIQGGAGYDYLAGGKGNDKIWGGSENDVVNGQRGHDTLKGDAGNDEIRGEAGNDKLFGGSGADVFYFHTANEGRDVIKDWEDGQDHILLNYGITNTAKFLKDAVSIHGDDVEIDLSYAGAKGIITIEDAAGQIDAGDFYFV